MKKAERDRLQAEAERAERERAMAMAAAGRAMLKAMGDDPLGHLTDRTGTGSNGAVDIVRRGLSVRPAADASASPAVAAVTLEAGGSAGSLGVWRGRNYSRRDAGTKVANAAVVYTNTGVTVSQLMSVVYADIDARPANVPAYVAGTGAARGAGTLTIGSAPDSNIGGSMFPTAGKRTWPDGRTVSFPGTYEGAAGTYVCDTGGGAGTCEAAFNDAGISLSSGSWTFVHPRGAMVSRPGPDYLLDADHVYFGWWLRSDRNGMPVLATAFSGARGVAAPTVSYSTIWGPASYAGKAAGQFGFYDPLAGTGDGGRFTADASLTAEFGTGSEAGVTGTIDNFTANGRPVPWSVSLRRAGWGANGAIDAPADDAATRGFDESLGTVWSIDGNPAPASGTWSGQMYDEARGDADDGSNVPTTVVGTFQSSFGSFGRMVGGFGARRQ